MFVRQLGAGFSDFRPVQALLVPNTILAFTGFYRLLFISAVLPNILVSWFALGTGQ